MDYALRLTAPRGTPIAFPDNLPEPWRAVLPEGTLTALYFGTEFCEHRLPTVEEAKRFCDMAHAHGLEAVMLTPIVRDAGLDRLAALLGALRERGCRPTVTFNDWGVARLIRRDFPDLKLQGGRLLNRALRDPRLVCDPAVVRRVENPDGERSRMLRRMLSDMDVCGLESDADMEGGFLGEPAPGFRRVFHFPYVFATTGRSCLARAAASADNGSMAHDFSLECQGPCRGGAWEEKRDDVAVPLFRAGNTLFYEAPAALVAAHLPAADLLVVHPEPTP